MASGWPGKAMFTSRQLSAINAQEEPGCPSGAPALSWSPLSAVLDRQGGFARRMLNELLDPLLDSLLGDASLPLVRPLVAVRPVV